METRTAYPSDLTDAEWDEVGRVIPAPKPGGRPAKHTRRDVVNAILYVARTGCEWRDLPGDFPAWATVYWYFRLWEADGTFDRLRASLGGGLRLPSTRHRPRAARPGLRTATA